jgi:hypothetical protein
VFWKPSSDSVLPQIQPLEEVIALSSMTMKAGYVGDIRDMGIWTLAGFSRSIGATTISSRGDRSFRRAGAWTPSSLRARSISRRWRDWPAMKAARNEPRRLADARLLISQPFSAPARMNDLLEIGREIASDCGQRRLIEWGI